MWTICINPPAMTTDCGAAAAAAAAAEDGDTTV
jgi:hypothetical protein